MRALRNKIFLAPAIAAGLFFISLTLGGEFLHGRVHHHATASQHDDCPLVQFAAQAIVAVVVFALAALAFLALPLVLSRITTPVRLAVALANPRAPPLSL